jgi:hypothetical protein
MARHPCGTRWQARKVTGAFICSLNESGRGEGGGDGERGRVREGDRDRKMWRRDSASLSLSAPAPPFFLPLSLLLSLSRAQSVLPLAIPLISLSLPLCPPPCLFLSAPFPVSSSLPPSLSPEQYSIMSERCRCFIGTTFSHHYTL